MDDGSKPNQQGESELGTGPAEAPGSHDDKPPEAESAGQPSGSRSSFKRFPSWYGSHKKLAIPISIAILLAITLAVPLTRYKTLGLFIKKDVYIYVVDLKSGNVVSSAQVDVDSRLAETDGRGTAKIGGLAVGRHLVKVAKKHYKPSETKITVGLFRSGAGNGPQNFTISIEATGRPVSLKVTNKINGQVLEGVVLMSKDAEAKTDQDGLAQLIVPVGIHQIEAELSLKGYNTTKTTILVSDTETKQNEAALTPSGKIYFLSKKSGRLDVVKTDLDGANRETALTGTGKEDNTNTVLLASRDWKYLALLSRRDSALAKLYLIDTQTDKLSVMDEGNADFSLVGWVDSSFVYTVNRRDVKDWQPKGQALKSYDATNKRIVVLSQTDGQGTGAESYASEYFGGVKAIGKNLIYEKLWSIFGLTFAESKKIGIYGVNVNGSGAQTLKTFDHDNAYGYIDSIFHGTDEIYFRVSQEANSSYYAYENGKIVAKGNLEDEFNAYYGNSVTYLRSPSGNSTFWAESRDGKNTLFVGDEKGKNPKQVAAASKYLSYGWFTDDYLLVSKDSSELYILPRLGIREGAEPLKITDYHKPAQDFYGHGDGYGGI